MASNALLDALLAVKKDDPAHFSVTKSDLLQAQALLAAEPAPAAAPAVVPPVVPPAVPPAAPEAPAA